MLAKLIKFVILTRFSKPLLAILAFFLVYETVIGTITTGSTGKFTGFYSYYAIGASVFFMTMSLLLGGLFVLKSDRDYLLTLPLSKRELSVSLFVAQFIGSGITILFLYGFYVAGAGDIATTILLIVNLTVLACVVTAFGVISNILETWKRILLALGLAAWCLSALIGFQLTPVSSFVGSFVYGTIALFVLAAAVVPVALRELANLELGSIRSLLRATSSEYKKNMSFSGKGPIRTVYSYHLSFLEIVGRFNIGGSTSYRATRVKTSTALLVSILAASAYFAFEDLSPIGGMLQGQHWKPLVFILPIFLGVITIVLMSQGTLSNERGWLAFTAMDPATYLRHLLLSRFISTLAIIGPFGAANIALGLMGEPSAFQSSIVLFVTIPTGSLFVTYLVARLGAVQQVKEEGLMPGQFELKQFVVVLLMYFIIGLVVISELFIVAAAVISTILIATSILLLARRSVWRGLAFRLTERGFV